MSKLMDFTPLALKNLFSKPATRNYPAEQRDYPIRSRGHIVNDFDSCILCGICQKKCPSDAITVNRAEKSWSINRMGCVQCSNCVNACPKKCLSIVPGYTEPNEKPTVDIMVKPAEEEKKIGTLSNDISKCVLCGICQKQCPNEAIAVDRKETKTWTVDLDKCVKCGACVDKCPKKCLSLSGNETGVITKTKE